MRGLKRGKDRCSPQRHQHGAVAVFVAISLVAILAAVALSIDIGRLYFAQRDLQRLAVLGALSAAQQVSGCANDGVPGGQSDAEAEVTNIIKLNNPSGTVIGTDGINGSPYVELGKVETTTDGSGLRGFVPLTDGDPDIDSVRVNLTTLAPARLLPFLGSSSGTLYASATATQSALGSLSVGSGVASLNQGLLNSLLSGLLGGNVNLSVADYTGLANVDVTVSQLATALGVSVTDLSDPTTLNQTVLLSAALSNLTGALSGGVVNPQVISTLQNLAGQTTNTTPIPLGSILGPVGKIAGDVPFVNLQDLITALALASRANASGGPSPIQLNNTIADIPGVAAIKVFATVIQPPKLSGLGRAGQTSATTAQILLSLRIQAGALLNGLSTGISSILSGLLNLVGGVLGLKTNISVAPPPLNIGIDAEVAPATAYLDKLQCPAAGVNNGQPIASLSAETGIANVNVGTFSNSNISAPLSPATAASLPLADVNLDASKVCVGLNILGLCIGIPINLGQTDVKVGLALTSLGVGPSGRQYLRPDVTQFTPVVDAPSPTYLAVNPGTIDTNPQTISAAASAQLNLGLTSTQTGSGLVGALGGLVNGLVNGITGLVQPLLNLVNGLLTSLIDPLLQTLGVGLGNATVTMDTVTVARPAIVTECLPGVALPRGCPALP